MQDSRVAERLPGDVSTFVQRHISSVEQLEGLLLVREERGRGWTAAEIGKRLRRSAASVDARMTVLAQNGLVERDGDHYRYGLGGIADRQIEAVEHCYRSRRAALIEAIFRADHTDGAD